MNHETTLTDIEAGESPPAKPIQNRRKVRKHWWSWRRGVQAGFVVLNLVIGYQFYLFVRAAHTTTSGELPIRPPGVEGWLPISGLMGLIDWIGSGFLNTVHPAATILLAAFIAVSLLLRKAFCSWLCPAGFLSDLLANLGSKLWGRNFRLPRALDLVLLSIKYLLLAFFLWAFYAMGLAGIAAFIESPYNQIADVKMMLFFTELGSVAIVVLIALTVGSVFVHGFWCRYLCPYGALLGFFSWISPVKVRRNPLSCIDCGKCDKVCPSRLPIMIKSSIISVECTGCMECVEICPVKDTLHMGTKTWKPRPRTVGIATLVVFLLFVMGARLFGVWQTSVTDQEYRYHISRLRSAEYGHPGM